MLDSFEKDEGSFLKGTVAKVASVATKIGLAGTIALSPLVSTLCRDFTSSDYDQVPTYRNGYLDLESDSAKAYSKAPFEFMSLYSCQQSDVEKIVSYVHEYPFVQDFLVKMSEIIDNIYPGLSDKKFLNCIMDPDTGEPLLELVFESGLPLDEEFLSKDRAVFEEIDACGIADGLKNVVFVNS
ncbi:hypothetical protein [Desulforhopalus singaporensis]|nr:hypothetical protein [Desulforhopalus singaporensis]